VDNFIRTKTIQLRIESCEFVKQHQYTFNESKNIICLMNDSNEHEKKWNNVSGLYVSIWNHSLSEFEIDCVLNCTLLIDDMVYSSYSYVDIIHNQYAACGKTGQHIILPFTSKLLQNHLTASINFSRAAVVNLEIQLKKSEHVYSIYISLSRYASLSFKNKQITFK